MNSHWSLWWRSTETEGARTRYSLSQSSYTIQHIYLKRFVFNSILWIAHFNDWTNVRFCIYFDEYVTIFLPACDCFTSYYFMAFYFVVAITTSFFFSISLFIRFTCSQCSYVTNFGTYHAMENRTIHGSDEFNGAKKKWKESLLNLVFDRLTDWKSKATANNVETANYMKKKIMPIISSGISFAARFRFVLRFTTTQWQWRRNTSTKRITSTTILTCIFGYVLFMLLFFYAVEIMAFA